MTRPQGLKEQETLLTEPLACALRASRSNQSPTPTHYPHLTDEKTEAKRPCAFSKAAHAQLGVWAGLGPRPADSEPSGAGPAPFLGGPALLNSWTPAMWHPPTRPPAFM